MTALLGNLSMPMCAVCGRPCERMEATRDLGNQATTFRVECHGSVESATVTDLTMACAISIKPGVAFSSEVNDGTHGGDLVLL